MSDVRARLLHTDRERFIAVLQDRIDDWNGYEHGSLEDNPAESGYRDALRDVVALLRGERSDLPERQVQSIWTGPH